MLVHPTTTDTPLRRQSSQLLSRILDVSSPAEAHFDTIWTFTRKRKHRDLDSDDEDNLLETESRIWEEEERADRP